jgi:cytoskeletal protein RodZ
MFEIGASLREARLKRNLTPADVQKAIRIRDRYLQALEEERWELLPGDAYVKGFLRTYADYLGLDGNLYVEEYNSRFARPEDPLIVPERFAGSSRLGGVGFLRPLVVVVAIVAIVAAVAAWQLGGSSSPKQGAQSTSTPPTTTVSHHQTTPRGRHRHSHHVSVALPSGAVVVASRGNSWLWVRAGSASGPTVYQGTLLQGKTLPVNLKSGPVWIRFGYAPAVDLRLGGKLVHGLPNGIGNVLLTRRGIRPA